MEVTGPCAWPEQLGQHLDDCPQLCVAVLGRLYDPPVQTHGRVVDESTTVHLGEVNAVLHRVEEGVEGAEDVGPVYANVEGEVVAGARRDTDVGERVGGRHGRHGAL